ncbi:chromate transporter [Sedimentibacter acidaminivorans]|jgi:chromate transporter|uniref:Chromate transporter n=1 Tax=Sedimentibacter acidaminivorans TaxID=913099 RepID=A0ABS4G9M9_9FIRM|nr:chromate transporter [Sedimentibacter acidaminivorans]MBP1924401.1 chromate transporter [Sedimentibacter acidaminivorans]
MEKNLKFYFKLFITTFSLSAFTIGGGYVIVPLMRQKFVEELKWIEEEEMLNIVAISQSAPGPIAVNTSIMTGYRLAGVLGAFVSILGTALPPLIIITVVSKFYDAIKNNSSVNAVLLGMRAGVAAVIINVIIKMVGDILKKKNLTSIIIMVLSFLAAVVFNINAALIIVICGVFGAIIYSGLLYKFKGEHK